MKVCHITSAHKRYDTRILYKECKSLKKKYNVTLLVNDCDGAETIDGINIVSTGKTFHSRIKRMLFSRKTILTKAITINAELYHLHDPELLRIAKPLLKNGKKVIFDSHEDYPLTIKEKQWIPKWMRSMVSYLYKKYEMSVVSKIDGLVACYHWTKDRYVACNKHVELIFNFPIVEQEDKQITISKETHNIVYAGGISKQWCHAEVVKAVNSYGKVRYLIAGNCDKEYLNELNQLDRKAYINYVGTVTFNDVDQKIYKNGFAGVALLDYIGQCKGTIGNLSNTKLFEYMHAGLPVICTDFQLWKAVVEKERCGICVNPHNINEIMEAIKYLDCNREEATKMGINGFNAVKRQYNWETEEKKLLKLYECIIND